MGKSTGSIAVALVVGAAIGFVGGRASKSGSPTSKPAEMAAKPSEVGAKPATPPKPGAPAAAQYYNVPVDPIQPQKGPSDALVTIVESSEFQCPFCARVAPTVKQIADTYGNDVRIVWANNPLSFHKDAMPAAIAAYAAHEQGKFWEFHDKAFANQKALTRENFEAWAQELGLDMGKFKAALDSQKYKDQIEKEQKLMVSRGARGTPAFFINGRYFSGAQPFEKFKEVIDAEKANAEALLKKGVAKKDLYAKLIEGKPTAAQAPPGQPAAPTGPVYVEVPGDTPVKGAPNAKVTIVEFSDFQCPFCSRVNPTLKQIQDTYGNDVRIAFRHLPLPFHKDAPLAAEASMAAHEQGKFWQMHDALFANNKALKREDLEKYAQEIGLDMNKFKAALDSGKYKAKVEADAKAANSVGARGTPAFFINGMLLSGAQPFEKFKEQIDKELARANEELKKGTPPDQLYAKLTQKK